ncbi:MAG: hypothetical protein KGH49_00485 [Candidatus Micrarchaeota archaeon]|nr:hypothetical protein [Candidatus Micrarchaeota archaeon]
MGVKQQISDKGFKVSKGGRTVEIFITDKTAAAADSDSLVPKGYRKISLEEGTFAWKNSEDFRNNLIEKTAIWTNQKGLKSNEYHKIEIDNTFTSSTFGELSKLPTSQRSYHYSGNGLVALVGSCNYWSRGLLVLAYVRSDFRLRVAYTKLGGAEPQKSAGNISAELRQKAQREIESLNKIVKPEAIEALSELVRAS